MNPQKEIVEPTAAPLHRADCSTAHSSDVAQQPDARWRQRLTSLTEEEQRRISKKYYGGSMPWKSHRTGKEQNT